MAVQLKSKTSFLVRLSVNSARDAAIAGAKAANEAELLSAGFTVPNGFVLTTDAFERFLAFNDIGSDGEPTAIANAPLPADVAGTLEQAAAALDDTRLAVRSSAVAEDLPGASFAGSTRLF